MADTPAYFANQNNGKDFFIFKGPGPDAVDYKWDDFFMSLSDARYYHPFSSVISKEGYQVAVVSNNPTNTQKEHTLFQALYLSRPEKFKNVGFLLSTSDDNNYYHCLFQIAPKIWTLEKYGYTISNIDHFFLELSASSFQEEILAILNISRDKLIDLGHYKHIEVEQLLLAPNFETPEPWVCHRIRSLFLNAAARQMHRHGKIYLSRKWSRFRKLLNEKEFMESISKFDFELICTEGMSIVQQAALFKGARIIIGPHGAGLANIVFCKKHAVIIELRARSHTGELATVYEQLSGILQLRHFTYMCDEYINEFGKRAIYLDLYVNVPEFEELHLPVLATPINKVL